MNPDRAPTFSLLREKRRLAVRNPENGVRFTVSLRDWEGILWAVRVHPGRGRGNARRGNPYTTGRRIIERVWIADWIAELRLA